MDYETNAEYSGKPDRIAVDNGTIGFLKDDFSYHVDWKSSDSHAVGRIYEVLGFSFGQNIAVVGLPKESDIDPMDPTKVPKLENLVRHYSAFAGKIQEVDNLMAAYKAGEIETEYESSGSTQNTGANYDQELSLDDEPELSLDDEPELSLDDAFEPQQNVYVANESELGLDGAYETGLDFSLADEPEPDFDIGSKP